LGTQLQAEEEQWPTVRVAVARERVFRSPRAEERARRSSGPRRQHRPVFVDDSGRRRRAARVVGASAGLVASVYVAFVGLTFAGVPGLGEVGAPGLASLTQPAGDQADVGRDPVEQAVPAAVAQPAADASATGQPAAATVPIDGATQATPTSAPGSATTTSPTTPPTTAPSAATPSTTSTTLRGNGPGSAVPGPNSTVPDHGGPPTSRPSAQ
jgi:hypothetical protein